MNKHSCFQRIFCLLIAVLLLYGLNIPTLADGNTDEIHIRTAKDLIALAEHCRLDVWSKDKEIFLDCDLSLSGMDFTPIRYFDGTFHGNDHTISGLNLTGNYSPCGLFTEIGSNGVVEKLSVHGSIAPSGSGDSIGGIAGINRGLIAQCSFTGSVFGKNMVGGIAGQNFAEGGLVDCRSIGSVLGGAMVGGIVGSNEGSILSAVNESYVNTESTDPKLNISDLNITQILKNFNILSSDTAGVVQDSGGIAGYNSGMIGLSENTATVGYQHTGYNTGGIAGRSCGYLYDCKNTGEVFGRKDVGGIIGQMEPYVASEVQTDLLANLNSQYRSLTWVLNEAAEDAASYGDKAADRYHEIADQFQPVADAFRNANIHDEGSLENIISSVSDSLTRVSNSMDGLGNDFSNAGVTITEDMDAINRQISAISGATSSLIYSVTHPDFTNVISDTSDQDLDKITYGKAASCENIGSIEADRDVGGIVGQISVEDSSNPEDDLNLSLGSTLRTEYEYKAVLLSCINRGCVTARKDYAGSVVGMSSLGYLTGCQGYGSVTSENGSYVGGISGLNMAKITDCWTKARLSGEKYVGGITGCGSSEGNGSIVKNCVSFSQIAQCQQFSGAISGSADGEYRGNLFVSDSLQGIDGLNISGAAEPGDYSVLLDASGFPDDCRSFTLTFLADDEVVAEIPFDFGDSIPDSRFPKVPEKEGYFGTWQPQLQGALYSDQQLEAEYTRMVSILPSNLTRANNRAALYVEGSFDEDAAFLVAVDSSQPDPRYEKINGSWLHQISEQLHAALHKEAVDPTVCRTLIERLSLTIPDDGADTHTVRYTPPEGFSSEKIRIFLDTPDGLQKLPMEVIGAYSCITVNDSSAQLAIYSTVRTGWMVLISFAGLAAIAACILAAAALIRKQYLKKFSRKVIQNVGKQAENLSKEKKLTLYVSVVLSIVCLIAAVAAFRSTPLWASIQTGKEVRALLKTNTQTYHVSISGELGSREYSLDGSFCQKKDVHIVAMTLENIPVFLTENRVYLENGSAYTISDDLPNWAELLPLVVKAYRSGKPETEITDTQTCCRLTLSGEHAKEILSVLLPKVSASTPWQPEEMTVALESEKQQLTALRLYCIGETHAGAPVSLTCTITPSEEELTVPQSVTDAITKNVEPSGTLTADLLTLAECWANLYNEPSLTGSLTLTANCGTLVMNDQFGYRQTLVDGTCIRSLTKNQHTVYFTKDSICTAEGKALPDTLLPFSDAAQLLNLLESISMHSSLHTQAFGDTTLITVQISIEDADALSQLVIGSGKKLELALTGGTVTVTVKDSQMQSICLTCEGLLTVVRNQIPASVSAELTLAPGTSWKLPDAVHNALIIPEA